MRTAFAAVLLAGLGLAACNSGSGDGGASDRAVQASGQAPRHDATTGAGGAVTGSTDPNPTGAGATTDAEPGAPSSKMGATNPASPAPPPQ
jgi:predicted small secreted protein